MILKYKVVVNPVGAYMMPSPTGEYIKYEAFVKETETLRDYNFSLQDQLLSEQQNNEELERIIYNLKQTKKDLVQVIVGLNTTISKKEQEITAISDRLNRMYLSDRAN